MASSGLPLQTTLSLLINVFSGIFNYIDIIRKYKKKYLCNLTEKEMSLSFLYKKLQLIFKILFIFEGFWNELKLIGKYN